MEILQNQLHCINPWLTGWAYHLGHADNYPETVVRATFGMGTGHVGDSVSLLAAVHHTSSWGVVGKLRDNNGDGLADTVSFHPAVATTFYIGSTSFFNISTPRAAGIATMSFSNSGDTVTLKVADLDGQNPEVFSADGVLGLLPLGTRVGVAYVGDVTIDDFQAFYGPPQTPALTSSPMRVGQPADLYLTGAAPNAPLLMALSVTGGIAVPTPLGTLGLAPPLFFLDVPPADANGRMWIAIPSIPAELTGLQMWLQILDFATPALSTYLSTTPW